MNRVNVFSPELREIVEADVYLAKVQRSLTHKTKHWSARGMDTASYMARSLHARIVETRRVYRQDVLRLGEDIPIVWSATGVRGVGAMSFIAVAMYIDIEKAPSPAALWRYCGYGLYGHTPDTVASIRRPGLISFNDTVRRSLAIVRWKLLIFSPYRPYYTEYAQRQLAAGQRQAIAYRRAQRYTVKLWLKHLWLVWRRQEGLPLGLAHENDETGLAAPFGWR